MTVWENYRRRIDQAAQRRNNIDDYLTAKSIVASMPPAAVHDVFIRLTQREIEKMRDVQELCTPTRSKPTPQPDMEPIFAEILDHPQRLHIRSGPRLNARGRAKFRRWCADNDHDFGEWLERLLAVTPERWMETVKLDWMPGYRTPSMEERDRQLWETTTRYIEEFAQAIRFEVTTELLGTTFHLSDGRVVTWRDATVADHEDRVDALGHKAQDAAERAAMHQRAIDLLKRHSAESLGQIPEKTEVAQ